MMQIEDQSLADAEQIGGDFLTLVLLQHAGFLSYELDTDSGEIELWVNMGSTGERIPGLRALIERVASSVGLVPVEGPDDGALRFGGELKHEREGYPKNALVDEMRCAMEGARLRRALEPLSRLAESMEIDLRVEQISSPSGVSLSVEVELKQESKADRDATRLEVERLVAKLAEELGMELEVCGQDLRTHLAFLQPVKRGVELTLLPVGEA
jgi:hypothetical protein